MKIFELSTQNCTIQHVKVNNKKRALGALAELLSTNIPQITSAEILKILLTRERLGATGIGSGVAIPHGRIDNLEQPITALIKLETPVPYDAIDDIPVDLMFALLVPTEAAEQHLQILANLAELCTNQSFLKRLRATHHKERISDILQEFT